MGNQLTDERKGCENLVGLYKPYGTDEHESSGRELGGPESHWWRFFRPKVAGIRTDFYIGP